MLTISPSKLTAVIQTAHRYETNFLRSVDGLKGSMRLSAEPPRHGCERKALVDVLDTLTGQEMEEILTLAWIGRGDFAPAEWDDASSLAHAFRRRCKTECLATLPLLPDYLEEGLARIKI